MMSISQPISLLRARRSFRIQLRAIAARISRSLREFMVGHAIGA